MVVDATTCTRHPGTVAAETTYISRDTIKKKRGKTTTARARGHTLGKTRPGNGDFLNLFFTRSTPRGDTDGTNTRTWMRGKHTTKRNCAGDASTLNREQPDDHDRHGYTLRDGNGGGERASPPRGTTVGRGNA